MKNRFIVCALSLIAILIIIAFGNVLSIGENYHNGIRFGKILFQLKYLTFALPFASVLIAWENPKHSDWVTILLVLLMGWILFIGREGSIWNDEKAWYFFTGAVFFLLVRSYIACLNVFSDHTFSRVLIGFLVTLSVLGGIEGALGELQLLNRYTIYHSTYLVSGTFFNPAPFAGYLIASLPFAICLIRLPVIIKWSTVFRGIGWITALMMLVILPVTQSRAGWIGLLAAMGYYIYDQYKIKEKIIAHFRLKKTLVISMVAIMLMLLSVGGYSIYKFKEGSADGRMLIWKVSINILQQSPWVGVGFNTFPAYYAPALANYFSAAKGSEKEKMLAGNVQWVFNEPLHMAVELGVVGGLLYLILVVAAILLPVKEKWKTGIFNLVLVSARSSLIAIFFFGLFSYPFYSASIVLLFFFSLAMIAFALQPIQVKTVSYTIKGVIFAFLVVVGFNMYGKLEERKQAYAVWETGESLYQLGSYEAANENFKKALAVLSTHGQFLQQYAKSLQLAGDNKNAIKILNESGKFYKDEFWYLTLGEANRQVGNYEEAEKQYRIAAQMIPHKLYPRYLLAKLYETTGQEMKAKAMAHSILRSKVKVTSLAVKEIQKEMQDILNKGNVKPKP